MIYRPILVLVEWSRQCADVSAEHVIYEFQDIQTSGTYTSASADTTTGVWTWSGTALTEGAKGTSYRICCGDSTTYSEFGAYDRGVGYEGWAAQLPPGTSSETVAAYTGSRPIVALDETLQRFIVCPSNSIYDEQLLQCKCNPGYFCKGSCLVTEAECELCPVGSYCEGGNLTKGGVGVGVLASLA